ncbi:type II toxin-antitoxin system VapC family toxin [Thiofilum flexile]|uniref:type II toxin-antitoxin system VapC family toxin n=1 Tax=Thiofilum flexile TaxID=125627 RepID=UPI00037A6B4C|nr:type II toxin-antitoxin system VapC family toxin [Thiofilum flexile]
MIAVDTNILVRLLVQDDALQAKKAEQLFANEQIFIADTVLLETEWVLRFAYKLSAEDIYLGLTQLLGLENVLVRDELAIQKALNGFQSGLDFADAWHLVQSQHCEKFATFDIKLIKKASGLFDCTPFNP